MNVKEICLEIERQRSCLSENQELNIVIQVFGNKTYSVKETDFSPIPEENIIQIHYLNDYIIISFEDIISLDFEVVSLYDRYL